MMDEHPRAGVTGGDGPQVQLQAVAPRVSSPMLHGNTASNGRPARAETADVARHPWDPNHRTDIPGDPSYQPGRTDAADDVAAVQAIELGAGIDGVAFEAMRDRARLIGGVAAAGGTIVAFSIAQGDLRNALAVGALVVGLAWLWTFDRHVSFSFGEGFLGYRAQMGWPRGVQEDDTVRWDWHVKIDDRTLDVGRPGTR